MLKIACNGNQTPGAVTHKIKRREGVNPRGRVFLSKGQEMSVWGVVLATEERKRDPERTEGRKEGGLNGAPKRGRM